MQDKIKEIRSSLERALADAADSAAVEAARIGFLGKKGLITDLLKELKDVSGDKRELGQMINELKKDAEAAVERAVVRIAEAERKALLDAAPRYDVSLPACPECGSYHPITLIQREVEEIFASMGFTIEDYAEVTDDFNCFEALNIPKHHPARDMQDTFYLSNGQLLKTHTSAAQNTIMKKYGAPLRAVFPSRCFRNEATDACHENTFFQMEGMMIDTDVSISNLIYFMKTMLSEVFKQDVKVRLRPGFFPFV